MNITWQMQATWPMTVRKATVAGKSYQPMHPRRAGREQQRERQGKQPCYSRSRRWISRAFELKLGQKRHGAGELEASAHPAV